LGLKVIGKKSVWSKVNNPQEIIMHTSTMMDNFAHKWEECTIRVKSLLINAFLNECGENGTWEEWRAFLQEHNVEAFDWSTCD
jgi:hypothetical protein